MVRSLQFLALLTSLIITRHDVKEESFLKYGENTGFNSLALFDHGNGTLIHPEWVLTAEHVTIGVVKGSMVKIDGELHEVEYVLPYPQAKVDSPFLKKDLAMVKLKSPVLMTRHAEIIKSEPLKDEVLHLVGNGRVGNGLSSPTTSDGRVRGATNRIDTVGKLYIQFDFDHPSDPRVTKLEGIAGLGDSGGPAYIKRNGKLYLAGVSSFQESPDVNTPNGHYGVIENYVNVHNFKTWIDMVIEDRIFFETVINKKKVVVEILDQGIIALEGNELEEAQLRENEMELRAEYEEIISERNDVASKLPRFLKFIEQIALKERIIDSIHPVSFVLSGKSLIVNGKRLSDQSHRVVLTFYSNEFGEMLEGDSNITYDPNG